jgi:hypothetical protein
MCARELPGADAPSVGHTGRSWELFAGHGGPVVERASPPLGPIALAKPSVLGQFRSVEIQASILAVAWRRRVFDLC